MAKYTRYTPMDFGGATVAEPAPSTNSIPAYEDRGVRTTTVSSSPAEEPTPVYTTAAPRRKNTALWVAAPLALLAVGGLALWAGSGSDDAGERETAAAESSTLAATDADAETVLPADAATVPVEVAEAEPAPLPAATPLPTPVVRAEAPRVAVRTEAPRVVARARPAPAPAAAPAAEDAAADVSATVSAPTITPTVPSTPAPTPAVPAAEASVDALVDAPPLQVEATPPVAP
jgi:hypothetical protein